MYHIVYLTTNLVNNKIYVGVHSTYNLNDGYLGSGIILSRSIKKYGERNFKRDILYYCLSRQDALDIESLIVNRDFVNNESTYNIHIGGGGNKGFLNTDIRTRISNSKIESGMAKGQNNNASKSKMSEYKIIQKNLKTAETRKNNGSYIVSHETRIKQSEIRKQLFLDNSENMIDKYCPICESIFKSFEFGIFAKIYCCIKCKKRASYLRMKELKR